MCFVFLKPTPSSTPSTNNPFVPLHPHPTHRLLSMEGKGSPLPELLRKERIIPVPDRRPLTRLMGRRQQKSNAHQASVFLTTHRTRAPPHHTARNNRCTPYHFGHRWGEVVVFLVAVIVDRVDDKVRRRPQRGLNQIEAEHPETPPPHRRKMQSNAF